MGYVYEQLSVNPDDSTVLQLARFDYTICFIAHAFSVEMIQQEWAKSQVL